MKPNQPYSMIPDRWSMYGKVPQTRELIIRENKYIVYYVRFWGSLSELVPFSLQVLCSVYMETNSARSNLHKANTCISYKQIAYTE